MFYMVYKSGFIHPNRIRSRSNDVHDSNVVFHLPQTDCLLLDQQMGYCQNQTLFVLRTVQYTNQIIVYSPCKHQNLENNFVSTSFGKWLLTI